MLLSREQFRNKLDNDQLRIALVGMSNSGKSTCTSKLSDELQFEFFEVDEAINRELGIEDMTQAAQWMGYPFEKKYEANKRRYLDLEARFTQIEIPPNSNFVLDTTGSIIYSAPQIQQWIQQEFLVVGLEVSDELCQTLIDDYFTHPKTVIWGNEFSPAPNEPGIDAMKRCYPTLLRNRALLYTQLSHVQIPAELARDPSLSGKQFLDLVESRL